jgi:hypothetical protein
MLNPELESGFMHSKSCWQLVVRVSVLCLAAAAGRLQAQGSFTIVVGAPPPPPIPLINHGDTWHYHKGTNAPQAGWQTMLDASLDGTWAMGPGGFGYADNAPETALCQTLLTDMQNRYSTLYIRRTMEIDTPFDPSLRLQLELDWDDGFVVYLDGVEMRRGHVAGASNSPVAFTAIATNSHESSRGSSGNAPVTFDLGQAAALLPPDLHVLAIQGLNQASNSSDFVLIADLRLVQATPQQINGTNLVWVTTNSVPLSGTNTIPGAARVRVNGVDATFNAGQGSWSKTQSLSPGFNRLLLEVLDGADVPLFVTNQVIVYEASATAVGGNLTGNTTWSSALGVIHVTNNVTVAAGATLTLEPGTVVMFNGAFALRTTNGAIIANGTADDGIYFLPANGNGNWVELASEGTNGVLTLRHVEGIAGAVNSRSGSTGLLEDCYFHHYKSGGTPIAGCVSARSMTVRRCHFAYYHETLWRNTLMTVEDSLFEKADNNSSDALDFDAAQPGSVIRRCTFRHGPQGNSDAVDIGPGNGPSVNTTIADCLMFDFPTDKGVTAGEGVFGLVISNCLIYGCRGGIGLKETPGQPNDPTTANVIHCTVVENLVGGFTNYIKSCPTCQAGHTTNSYNNIVWGNLMDIVLDSGSLLVADHTLFGNTNIFAGPEGLGTFTPGAGIVSGNPLFVNRALRDYRLAPGSPAIGAGRGGANLGCIFPVGAPMAPSHPVIESLTVAGNDALIRFWADSERTYSLLGRDSLDSGAWTRVADVFPTPLPRRVTVTNALNGTARFYELVSPRVQ